MRVLNLFILAFIFFAAPNKLHLDNNNISSVEIWGENTDGRITTTDVRNNIVYWLNSSDYIGEKTCCSEERAPFSHIVIYLKDGKEIYVYLRENKIAITSNDFSIWVKQPQLTAFLQQNSQVSKDEVK